MKRIPYLASVAAIAMAMPAHSQDSYELGEIIVSGGLSPIEAASLGRAVSVLTEDEIRDRGISTVQDALLALPGVSVNGTSNSNMSVRIRGAESNHTLILIDGIEVAGGDGEYVLSGLETNNIERIEVLRGPQSVYYGSNASAGVINIITKRGNLGTSYGGAIEGGSGTTASAFVTHRTERGGVALTLSHKDDRGYDQSGDGGEKDTLERSTLTLSGDYLVTDALRLGFTFRTSDERFDYDSTSFFATDAASYIFDDPLPYSDRREETAGIFADYSMLDGRLTHRLAYERTENEQGYNGFPPTEFNSDALKYRMSFGLDGRSVSDADQLLNVLVERERDSSSDNPGFDRQSVSAAVEYRASFANGLDLQAGIRRDDNDVFKDATTWNLGAAYTFAQSGIRLHGSAGKGVVDPTYFELYANAFGYTGNPNLTPESNRSFDIGVEVPFLSGRGLVDVTYFNETLTDEIADVSTGPGTFSFVNQAGDSDREGLEVSGRVQATDDLTLRFAYTYLDATNPNGSIEIRRPQHELALGATMQTFGGRGSVAADLRHVSGNFDTQFWGAFQTLELPAFTTLDVAARYDLTDNIALTGRIENVFDDPAVQTWGYATRGRAAYVGLDARF